ncbi:MAG: hypothetical protein ACOYL5_09445 [Phototrophicaceae bacterium]
MAFVRSLTHIVPVQAPHPRWWDQPRFWQALALSQALAIVYWLVAYALRPIIFIWWDQTYTFRVAAAHFLTPNQMAPAFFNPPWVALILAPLQWVPLEASVFIQTSIYFAALTAVIYKFGGNFATVAWVLISYISLDAVFELNLEWIVALGLLLPVWVSPVLVLAKPQSAVGYYLSRPIREWPLLALVIGVLVGVSFLIWGNWVAVILENQSRISAQGHNIAPLNRLPALVSLAIGVTLAWLAFRRQDAALGVLATLFFTPYTTLYALPIHLAMLAIRWPGLARLLITVMWIVYGGAAVFFILRAGG